MMEETTCKPDYSNSMAEHLGIRFLPSTEDAVHAEMPVDHRTSQPFGMLNGGASLALAEIVAGHGSTSLCREGEYACGVQVSGNHLSAVPVGGKVFATGKLIHRGRSSHIWNIDITTPQGQLVSTVRVVNFILKRNESTRYTYAKIIGLPDTQPPRFRPLPVTLDRRMLPGIANLGRCGTISGHSGTEWKERICHGSFPDIGGTSLGTYPSGCHRIRLERNQRSTVFTGMCGCPAHLQKPAE